MGRRPFVQQRILEAAFDRFAVEGYEGVSTRDVAKAAGVGSASMFKHFPTKEALGRAVYAAAMAPIQAEFDALADRQPDPASAVRSAIDLLCRFYDQRPRALALLIFPPHEFTPWEVDPSNPAAVRSRLAALTSSDEDAAAVLWGAITGPLCDRFLRRRTGAMSPQAPALAERVLRLLPPPAEFT